MRGIFPLAARGVFPQVTRLLIPWVIRVIILLVALPIFLLVKAVSPLVTRQSLRVPRACPAASRSPRFIT